MAELITPYLLISSSLAKILQHLFSFRYVCKVHQKLKYMLSSRPKPSGVLMDLKGVLELEQSYPCFVWQRITEFLVLEGTCKDP